MLRHPLGGGAFGQGQRALQVPQRVRQQDRPCAVHHDLRDGDEQAEVRLAAAGPEEGDRRQLGTRDFGLAGQDAGRQRRARPQDHRRHRRQHDLHLHLGRARPVHQAVVGDRRRLGGRHGQARLQGQGTAGRGQVADRQERLK